MQCDQNCTSYRTDAFLSKRIRFVPAAAIALFFEAAIRVVIRDGSTIFIVFVMSIRRRSYIHFDFANVWIVRSRAEYLHELYGVF